MRYVMSGQSSKDDIFIFIMRHGEAESPCLDDKSRQLTPLGRQQSQSAALWLNQHFCQDNRVDVTLHSPYRRARQTLDEVARTITAEKLEMSEDITPDGSPRLVSDYVQARIHASVNGNRPIKKLLIVSHMPLVSYLVDELCQSYTTSLFATASIAVVKYSLSSHSGTLMTHYQGI